MKEWCNLDNFARNWGLWSDQKIVVNFMWLTTLMNSSETKQEDAWSSGETISTKKKSR